MRTQKVRVAAIAGGEDSEGGTYGSTDEMWKTELNKADPKSEEGWYGKGVAYWQDVPASVDGVLGGFGKVFGRKSNLRGRGRRRLWPCTALSRALCSLT